MILGVWWQNRRTAVIVSASSRSEAISKAKKKTKRGNVSATGATVRKLNAAEAKVVRSGAWLRTGAKAQKAGYKGKKGVGVPLGGYKKK